MRTQKSDTGLFFIAVLPPEEIQHEVTLFKQEIRDRYGSRHALNSPPHITLHMPFKWPIKKAAKLQTTMEEMAAGVEPFNIELKDFSAFPPRVIFVDVIENQSLRDLQKVVTRLARLNLRLDNGDYKNRGFHPHMTIAFRDLKKVKFLEAWEEFQTRNYRATFMANQLTLLQRLDGKWQVYRDYPFQISEM
ncbi:MAG: 2'-5' RNA ligase family protein [Bacteroidota bacterium]